MTGFDGINVQHGKLDAGSQDVMTAAKDIQSRLDQLEGDLKPLASDWTGAAKQAYEQASVGPSDLDLVELHDCFATAELVHYDNLMLCPEGGAVDFFKSGATWRDGSKPVISRSIQASMRATLSGIAASPGRGWPTRPRADRCSPRSPSSTWPWPQASSRCPRPHHVTTGGCARCSPGSAYLLLPDLVRRVTWEPPAPLAAETVPSAGFVEPIDACGNDAAHSSGHTCIC